ncbi:MAG: ribosome biogenesis GTP-binding protein YihA/YsxC [Calditrichaceae bacterium]
MFPFPNIIENNHMTDDDIFKRVSFVKSIVSNSEKPELDLPEIAFVGRSNVGKSSLLNAISNQKNLAKTSSTPGKTRLINYFNVSDLFYMVDLPGYGYAKISKTEYKKWQNMLESYLKDNDKLRLVCLLIDSRHELLKNDQQMSEWLDFFNIPYIVILTKSDKISKTKLLSQINLFKKVFTEHHIIPFSIKSKKYSEDFCKLLTGFLDRSK